MQTTHPDKSTAYRDAGWWDDVTLYDMFVRACDNAPDRCALADPPNRSDYTYGQPKRYSFRALRIAAETMAAELFASGIRQDDILVIQLPNCVEIVILYLALSRLGAIGSPVPMQYGRHELAHIAETLTPKAYIGTPVFRGMDTAEANGAAFSPETVLLPMGQTLGTDSASDEHLLAMQTYVGSLHPSGDDIFTICWTSGTTGRPKGVPRSYNHWRNTMLSCLDSVALEEGEALLNPFPFVNMAAIGGFLFVWLEVRGTLVLHHPLDQQVFLQQLQCENIVYTVAPPAVLSQLIDIPGIFDRIDLSKLRYILSGSAPLSPDMVKGFKERIDIDIINVFGSNEGCTLASCARDVPDPLVRATCFPRYGVEGLAWHNRIAGRMRSKLRDPNTGDIITGPGQTGELYITGPAVFDGYYKAPLDNAEVFDEDGWFRTGDLFEITGEGNVFYRFVGRRKDVIIRGGVNISPEELDILLESHPDILEAAVVGYPDKILGEKVAAIIVPHEGKTISLEDMTDFLGSRGVAVFKWPEKLVIVDRLPRNPTNKVIRSALKGMV